MAISETPSPSQTPTPRMTFPVPSPLSSQAHDAAHVSLNVTLPSGELPVPGPVLPTVRRVLKKPVPASTTSTSRRDLLARGTVGSRRRQRWENDRFLANPHFSPPLASDWEPRALHPKRHVLYKYASLWEHPLFPRHKEAPISAPDHVPKELKNRMKKAHGARGLLEELEREVRAYIIENEEREEESEAESEDTTSYYGEGEEVVVQADSDSEEEIVFVSKRERGGAGGGRGKVLIRSAEEDERGSFGRWMVHCIAEYYGLHSWSATEEGHPRIRYTCVAKPGPGAGVMPKPLYSML